MTSRNAPPLVSSNELQELERLIERLKTTRPLLRDEADLLEQKARIDFIALALGDRKEQATLKELERSVANRNQSKPLGLLDLPEEHFREERKRTADDLGVQVSRVQQGLDEWFHNGFYPAPAWAARVAVILRKAKRFDLEKEFLAAWCRHFGGNVGTTEAKLTERASKLGVWR